MLAVSDKSDNAFEKHDDSEADGGEASNVVSDVQETLEGVEPRTTYIDGEEERMRGFQIGSIRRQSWLVESCCSMIYRAAVDFFD